MQSEENSSNNKVIIIQGNGITQKIGEVEKYIIEQVSNMRCERVAVPGKYVVYRDAEDNTVIQFFSK